MSPCRAGWLAPPDTVLRVWQWLRRNGGPQPKHRASLKWSVVLTVCFAGKAFAFTAPFQTEDTFSVDPGQFGLRFVTTYLHE